MANMESVKSHLQENGPLYLTLAGGVLVGVIITHKLKKTPDEHVAKWINEIKAGGMEIYIMRPAVMHQAMLALEAQK